MNYGKTTFVAPSSRTPHPAPGQSGLETTIMNVDVTKVMPDETIASRTHCIVHYVINVSLISGVYSLLVSLKKDKERQSATGSTDSQH